jgi:DNA-binding GntR family transcriptional regulator
VREALRQLEGEGLVTVNLHRGAVVSTLSSDELQEICEIRSALETMARQLGPTRRTFSPRRSPNWPASTPISRR